MEISSKGARGQAGGLLVGTIERVTFANSESLYAVLRLHAEKGYGPPPELATFTTRDVTAVGKVDQPVAGMRVRLGGHWTQHREHGLQFEFEMVEVLPPADEAGLVKYLASERFKGIGEKLATRIVTTLGANAFDEILQHPEKLDRVRGLKPSVKAALIETVALDYGAHRTQAYLRGLGLGPVQSAAVVRKLGPDAEASVRADPFRLAGAVAGIGFATADKLASAMGYAADDPRRARAAIVHALKLASENGNSLLPRERLVDEARALVDDQVPQPVLDAAIEELARAEEIVVEKMDARVGRSAAADVADFSGAANHESSTTLDDDGGRAPETSDRSAASVERVWLPHLAYCERALAENLANLVKAGPLRPLATADDLFRAEKAAKVELHPLQREAVLGLLSHPVALLTGGPGVGKTTITRFVVNLARHSGATVVLASPTGRAAKRLAEATGHDAQTVHRLLGYEPATEGFLHNAHNPLEADLVIVDEISMLDVILAHHLVKALQPPTRLVLVGDPDQLPSVGPGNVLRDLIDSGCVPVHRLTQIYRQAEGSRIVQNAHRILSGEEPLLPERGDRTGDFYFFPCEEPEKAAELLVDVVSRRIPETFGLSWIDDVQVIAPMYRGECGVDLLNERLRAALGAGGREVKLGARTWHSGDRVIHTRNDYDKEVFNGDMGRIERIDGDGVVHVRYPERIVRYEGGELSDLQPAFAITVHRSQGGEFPCVVIALSTQHWMMLQRHLFYTAVTRAKELCVLVGSQRALRMALDNTDESRRESALQDRLRAALARP